MSASMVSKLARLEYLQSRFGQLSWRELDELQSLVSDSFGSVRLALEVVAVGQVGQADHQGEPGEELPEPETSDADYLRELVEKLRHIPATYGTCDYDIDRLQGIIAKL